MAPTSASCLVLLSTGRRIPLKEGLTIGRGPDNEVLLQDSSVSTHHASFVKVGAGWQVQDLDSTNGSWLNGTRVYGTAPIAEGDALRLGAVEFRVEGLAAFPPPLSAPVRPPPMPSMSPLPPPMPASHSQLPPALPPPMLAPPPPPLPSPRPMAKPKSHAGLWISLSACALLLLLTGAWFLRDLLLPQGGMSGILAFREAVGKDPREAFAEVQAPKQLAELNQVLWPTVEPEAGWAYFFRTCLVTSGARIGKRQAVLFYHPWSDTAFVTQWENQKKLIDMEMLPGEALRKGGARPYGGILGWTRLQAYAPPAVGMVTAQTLKAFEQAFARETSLETALPWLVRSQAREACRVACSLQFAQVVKSLVTFSASYDQPARIGFIRLLALGDAAVAQAPGTPPESAKALRNLPAKAWSGFQPTAFVDTEAKVLVMAHHRESPDLFLAVVFRREGAELIPERLDLLSFNACYGALK